MGSGWCPGTKTLDGQAFPVCPPACWGLCLGRCWPSPGSRCLPTGLVRVLREPASVPARLGSGTTDLATQLQPSAWWSPACHEVPIESTPQLLSPYLVPRHEETSRRVRLLTAHRGPGSRRFPPGGLSPALPGNPTLRPVALRPLSLGVNMQVLEAGAACVSVGEGPGPVTPAGLLCDDGRFRLAVNPSAPFGDCGSAPGVEGQGPPLVLFG